MEETYVPGRTYFFNSEKVKTLAMFLAKSAVFPVKFISEIDDTDGLFLDYQEHSKTEKNL